MLRKIIRGLGSRGYLKFIPSAQYIGMIYRMTYGEKMNWNNPTSFEEKLLWLKVYGNEELQKKVVDKIDVRQYIIDKIGERYLIPVLWQGESPKEIPYSLLPDQFVIKCTHGSHCNILVKNKKDIDILSINKQLDKWLKRSWYWYGREWPYKDLKPRIIIEKYMTNHGEDIRDYKFFCFAGKAEFCQVISDRFANETMDFFDTNWNQLEIQRINAKGIAYPRSNEKLLKPQCYEQMVEIANILSKDFKFARIDLYAINGKVFFGEITFFPADGLCRFLPLNYNRYLGDKIEL